MGPAGQGRARLQGQRGGMLGDQEVGEVDEEGQEGVEAQQGQEPWRAPRNPESAHPPTGWQHCRMYRLLGHHAGARVQWQTT